MFNLVNRSRSMKSMRVGGGAPGGAHTHGPESPVLGEPGVVSSFQLTKEDSSLSQNESVPSSSSSEAAAAADAVAAVEARNTYRHRPLPTPPRSKASSTMAERPSTSGGPAPHNASTVSFKSFADRRISKDDLYIRPQSSARGGYKSYHIPIRDNPASPVESPGDFSPARTFTVRTQTPDSMDSNMGTIAIGMAIGSPTHPPREFTSPVPPPRNEWQPQASNMSTSMIRASPEPTQQGVAEPAPPPAKQKSGRWKLFGRSKSKRLASPIAISSPMNLQQPVGSRAEAESIPQSSQATDLGRRNTERRPGESKPPMIRSQTAGPLAAPPSPKESKPPKLLSRMASTRSTRGERVKKSDISAPVHVSMQVPALPTKPAGNFLNVEIPDIKLERYSVMFGNVLGQPQGSQGPNGGQQQHQGASSLLARRQATLDRLKTINDQTMKEEEEKERVRGRRATSPQPTKSPAFSLSLFPATPSETANNPPQSPRHRSNTSPALLPSPSRSSFEPPRPRFYLEAARADAATPEPRAPRSHDVSNAHAFGPEQSGLLLGSPTDDQESEEIHLTEQLKPTIYEPEWQMITPSESTAPSSGAPSAAPSAKDRSPASVSSAYTHVTKPSLDESEPDDALRAAVEISIARQISISRQQRRMLRPLKTQTARVAGSPSIKSPVAAITVGRNERLSSTKSSTPTLISPGETFEQQIAQNRKSERIIVEDE
ncbi:uncharacterized protein CTRU02_202187 [Colletotrichum truncatum]|uniref:Uncharacterized protein n=1 Tax=Colletotrichum truncatum TaxID=5467 RepID=A0ACC3ZJL1_COLTU|nr:uncharacterized protein CTRU02_01349 [Colletotrichum truncatum]KAF6799670.1 hypothetical protein CTRU02_01349 [Colletotrichum truncatum]